MASAKTGTARKKQVTEADKSPAATGDLVADTSVDSGKAEPDVAAIQDVLTEQAKTVDDAAPGENVPEQKPEPANQEAAKVTAEPVPDAEEQPATQEPAPEQASTEDGQELEDVDASLADLIIAKDDNEPEWVLGHMDVKAKAPAGFWRCGHFFARDMAIRVYVVTRREDIGQVPGHDDFAVYVTTDEARRIYREPNLVILVDDEIIRG